MEKRLGNKGLLLLLLCALSWGPAYLFIKIAVPEIPPPTLVFLRAGIAWLILYSICIVKKKGAFNWKEYWKQYVILGITFNAIPFYLVSFGELYISSSLAGVLYSFTLIFTAILAHYFGRHDPLTKNKIIGICLGMAGLATIYLPIVLHENIKSGVGALMVIIACLSTSMGTVYARTHLQKVSGMTLLTGQLAVATAIFFPFALWIDRPYNLPIPSFPSIIGIIGLSVICTVAAYLLYYKTIQLCGPTYATFSLLLLPVVAMILGFFILHEQLTWNLWVGTPLILMGVLAVNPIFNKKL
jgi:drug/metabolite transporter (DMT)-like permease